MLDSSSFSTVLVDYRLPTLTFATTDAASGCGSALGMNSETTEVCAAASPSVPKVIKVRKLILCEWGRED